MWLDRYNKELSFSREDFVKHHQRKYGGQLPIWAAVEVIDWGSLAYLYRLSPIAVCDVIAARMKLTAAQLGSWIRALNIVRNYSAHHARMFNRVYTLKPRLPKVETHPELAAAKKALNRCFGQLTLIQYLLTVLASGIEHCFRALCQPIRIYLRSPSATWEHPKIGKRCLSGKVGP